jgi:hypothetical protein
MNNNIIRRISEMSLARNRRAISRATTFKPYTRKTLPIGLAVTQVGAPVAQIPRRSISRTRATAKTPKITYTGTDFVDRYAPQAYKNNTWKYYTAPTRNKVIFFNSKNGMPYTFTKEGRRVNVPMRYFERTGMNLESLRRNAKQRKTKYHTFDAYQKRLNKSIRTVRGQAKENAVYTDIDFKVRRYLGGNASALNNVPFSRLVWWANWAAWMGTPYVKYAGTWRRYSNMIPITRQNILNNIRHMWNFEQNQNL